MTLVVVLLAPAESQLDLYPFICIEVDLERHQRQSNLSGLIAQIAYLLLMKKELAHSVRFKIGSIAMTIRLDMQAMYPSLTFSDQGKGVSELTSTFTQGAHLGTRKHNARLKGLKDLIVVESALILSDNAYFLCSFSHYHFSCLVLTVLVYEL